MIIAKKRYRGLRWATVYFAEKILQGNIADIVEYRCALWENGEHTTLVTNLERNEEEIFSRFTKNLRYEIRRAEREGVKYVWLGPEMEERDVTEALNFYNEFVESKRFVVSTLTKSWVQPFIDIGALFISEAYIDDRLTAVHIYIADGKHAMLQFSGNLFRESLDNGEKQAVGRANKYLHWRDILEFKERGYVKYDWGGV